MELIENWKAIRNICVGVLSSRWFWLKSLFKTKFSVYPAVKLYGELGERRKANEKELRALRKRMNATKMLRGHQYLWGEMNFIRKITFHKVEKINLGKMTADL